MDYKQLDNHQTAFPLMLASGYPIFRSPNLVALFIIDFPQDMEIVQRDKLTPFFF